LSDFVHTNPLAESVPREAAWRLHLVVLLVYVALAVLLTWPTAVHVASHLPGDGGDDPAIAWNLWWVKHALLTLHTTPLHTDYMFYPIGINLAFYTLTVLNALTALPLTLTLGVVAASNLHMGFTMVAGGYGAFLLARQLGSRAGPAAFAGVCYAFASSQMFYLSLGQFNIASSHWLPYVVLFVVRARLDLRSPRAPLLAALFLTLQAWAEMTYASFALIFVVLYALYEAAAVVVSRRRGGHGKPATIAAVWWGLAALVFLLGITPLLAAMLPDMQAEGDFWVEGTGFAEWFSADLLGFLVPTMRHPLLGGWVAGTGIQAFDKGQHIYLGVTLLALAAIGIVWGQPTRKVRLWWLLAALAFAWLALGPTVHVNGADTGAPGPFACLQSLPFFKGNRYPSRYSVLLVLSLAMLAAPGVAAVAGRISSWWPRVRAARWLPAAFTALFLLEHLTAPLPQSDMRVPATYEALAAEPPGTLLDIPFAWRNGFRITGPLDPGFMFGQFYQTAHTRRLLQGNTSRNPAFKFQYFTEAPVINSLLALETGHALPPGRLEADRALAADVLRFFDIRHIVVRRTPAGGAAPGVTPAATLPYIEAALPVQRLSDDGETALFRVQLPPLRSDVQVDSTAPLVRLYLGEGWGPLVDQPTAEDRLLWAQRRSARVLVPLPGDAARMTLRLYVPDAGQRVGVRLNGWQSVPAALDAGWAEVAVDLPGTAVQSGLNDVWLDFDVLYPVSALPMFAAASGSAVEAGSLPYRPLVVQSAGQEVGDFAHIYVGGRDISLNERGYNVAALTSAAPPLVAAFDTHLDPAASQRFAEFIVGLPDGALVAAAAADEASLNLSAEGVAALRMVGASGDLRGKFRWSHALIGVKGSPPGTALEAMDGLRPVTLALGPAVTAPWVAAGVEWLRFASVD
jgi:hypothetical protein